VLVKANWRGFFKQKNPNGESFGVIVDPKIFITYSSKDQKVARTICTALENRGLACWISFRNVKPGQNYQEQIVKAIRAAKIMVLVFTANANNSNEIKKELALACQNNLVVIPVRIEDVTPNEAFAYEFATRQWIDLFDDWENSIGRLVELIAAVIDEDPSGDRTFATARRSDTVGALGEGPTPRKTWWPSRRALLMAAVLGVILVGSVGAWLADTYRTPVSPKETPAQPSRTTVPPAVDAEAKRRAEEAEEQRQAALKAEQERADAQRIADAKAKADAEAKRQALSVPTEPSPSAVQAPATPVHPAASSARPLSPEREWALKPKDSLKECDKCPEMIVVPAGSFTMGSPESEPLRDPRENPQHSVTIATPFAVGRFAVTFDEWDACVADGGCNGYKPNDLGGRGQRPVINVSWDDANAYVAWLSRKTGKSYRLLSEAEFEYAARAGKQTAYPWGNDIGKGNANCNGCGSQWDGKLTAPVGSLAANGFGLYDMVGNVWEWVEDCNHPNYEGAPTDGSAWTSGDCRLRVLRGGSWSNPPRYLRAASGLRYHTDLRANTFGFRVGRTLSPSVPTQLSPAQSPPAVVQAPASPASTAIPAPPQIYAPLSVAGCTALQTRFFGAKTVAIISDKLDAALAASRNAFNNEFRVVDQVMYPTGETDLAPFVVRVRDEEPAFVVFCGPSIDLFKKQARQYALF
jgi:formylglycine-generating enzyme required for sulfatase activity